MKSGRASSSSLTWSVSADAPLQSVLDAPDRHPLFHRTLTGSISWQVRNETPVRRALSSPRVAPRWAAALLALGATVAVEGAEAPLEALLRGEVQGAVSTLRARVRGVLWGEACVARTPADEPIVAAVAVVEMDGDVVRQARVALAGAWPEAARLAKAPASLVGGPLEEESIRAVAAAVEAEVAPKGDFRGSAEYRRAMAGVMTRRALAQCLPGGAR